MKIIHLSVRGLFGLYDYEIDLRPELSMLTGPNGYGKTTLLRIISSLDVERLYYYWLLRFSEVVFSFDDGTELTVVKTEKLDEAQADVESVDSGTKSREVLFSWRRGTDTVAMFSYDDSLVAAAIHQLRYYEPDFPNLQGVYGGSQRDALLLRSKAFNNLVAKDNGGEPFLMQLRSLTTTFIPANRIYLEAEARGERPRRTAWDDGRGDSRREKLPIHNVSEQMARRLADARLRFLSTTQEEDSCFVSEILSSHTTSITESEYASQTEQLTDAAADIARYICEMPVEVPHYDEEKSEILALYLPHLQKKLLCCRDIIPKVKLFDDMLGEKRFSDKKIVFSHSRGVSAVSPSGETISLDLLSSGEQNEIVMLFKLIFDVADGSILLIDEPENSLHVTWQRMVVPDLRRIAAVKKLQVVIATHSPNIVSQGIDETTDLFYLTKTQETEP